METCGDNFLAMELTSFPRPDVELRIAGLDGRELRLCVAAELRGRELLQMVRWVINPPFRATP